MNKLEGELGRPATDEEMCKELDVTRDEYYDLLNKAKSVSLLNIDDSASFNRGDKKLLMGLLENRRTSNPFSSVNYKKALFVGSHPQSLRSVPIRPCPLWLHKFLNPAWQNYRNFVF